MLASAEGTHLSTDIVEGVPSDEYVGGVGGDTDDPAMGFLQVRNGIASWVHMAPEVDVLRKEKVKFMP